MNICIGVPRYTYWVLLLPNNIGNVGICAHFSQTTNIRTSGRTRRMISFFDVFFCWSQYSRRNIGTISALFWVLCSYWLLYCRTANPWTAHMRSITLVNCESGSSLFSVPFCNARLFYRYGTYRIGSAVSVTKRQSSKESREHYLNLMSLSARVLWCGHFAGKMYSNCPHRY